jgi:hypothetical protein
LYTEYRLAQEVWTPPDATPLQLDCSLLASMVQQVASWAQVTVLLPPLELPEPPPEPPPEPLPEVPPEPLPELVEHSLWQFCCSQVLMAWPAVGQLPSLALALQFWTLLAL